MHQLASLGWKQMRPAGQSSIFEVAKTLFNHGEPFEPHKSIMAMARLCFIRHATNAASKAYQANFVVR